MAGFKKPSANVQPDGQIRRSQVVTTYGPGAMVDLLNSAVLIGGLDFWHFDRRPGRPGATYIPEPRLRDAIAERFSKSGRSLSVEKPFCAPPQGDDREPGHFSGIMALEFPQWFVCQSPTCRTLIRKTELELKGGRYWHRCGQERAFECVPVRFLGACRRGHCQEFPWIAYAHLGKELCSGPSLQLREGATGDFAEVKVVCACGAHQALVTAMGNVELGCDGLQPWLGPEGKVECSERLRLLVRTASNSYFAQVVSALSIPEPARELEDLVQLHWATLQIASPETLPTLRMIPALGAALAPFSDAQVLRVVRARADGKTSARDALRTAEFKQLVASPKEKPGDLPPPGEPFFAREAKVVGGLPDGVARVVVAPKLREVRAQIGFTRLEPSTADLQGEYDLEVKSAPLGLVTNWLPASEVRGEGVFLQLDEETVRAWEERPAVKARADELRAGYAAWVKTLSGEGQGHAPAFPGVRFYLLHSLSHLLISAISLECGYSASAIRERIYSGPSERDPATAMAAILLSTGTSGTEGTLGGLVQEGRKIREHLRNAYDLGRLCSNDPVCAAHTPQDDPAERHLEGAGCHGCLFIAECSCERFNRYLDRALVVPTLGHPIALAYFEKRP